jgi:ligand-binding sensor domain-containing protein/two-component sensor histidine kinase
MRTTSVKLFVLLFSALLCARVYGQEPAYKNYTTSDGLPSINVYSAVQDDEGFMWFATDNGVSRFDGTRFKNYSISDGLTDNTVLKIIKDNNGRLWFLTFNGKLCFYENGEIYNNTNSELLKKIKFASSPTALFQDSKDNLWIGLSEGIVEEISPTGIIKSFGSMYIRDIWEDHKHNVKILTADKIYTLIDSKFHIDTLEPPSIYYPATLHLDKDSSFLVVGKDELICRDSKGQITRILKYEKYTHAYIHYLYSDKENNIWIASKIGAVEFEGGQLKRSNEHHYLENFSITTVFQDKDKNLWFTTLGSGVFMIPSLSIKLIDKKSGLVENNITDIGAINDSLFVLGSQNGNIQFLKGDIVAHPDKSEVPPNGNIDGIRTDAHGNTWILTSLVLFKYTKGNFSILNQLTPWHKSLYISHKGTIWLGQGRGLSKIVNDKINRVWYEKTNRVYSFAELSDTGLWLGTDKGLYRFTNGKMISPGNSDSLLQKRINALAVTSDSTLWIATNGYGLVSYKNGIVKSYTKKEHLLSDHCNNLLAEGNKLYVATDNGLNIITLSHKMPEIESYSAANGLISNHINQVIRKKGHQLFLATDKGVIELDENNIPAPTHSVPYINSVLIDDKKIDIAGIHKLQYNQNNISIEFGAINYNVSGNTNFRYRLIGSDTAWSYTSSPVVKYLNLPPGKYRFELSTRDATGNWSSLFTSFNLYIQTPWWLTWWFCTLSILILLIIIFILARWRISIINRKLKQQKLIAESELKALRAQINPHFIYNSLNSIQDFIMQNQKEDANLYLAKFARLMRNILSHSLTPKIPVSEEIQSLQLYLDLESLRFNNRFTFNFRLDPNLNPDETLIPSMILQPYVENAVLHGIASKEQNGKIEITFSQNDGQLLCTIEDNGIGRKRAQEIKPRNIDKGSKSLGMKITKERIELLSIGEQQKIELQIDDMKDDNNLPSGTKVTIHFPKA